MSEQVIETGPRTPPADPAQTDTPPAWSSLITSFELTRKPTLRLPLSSPDPTDYRYLAVRELVANLMSDAVGTTVKATVRQTVEAIRQLATPEGVTVKQLADHLQLERSAAQYRVQAARDGGFIVNIEDRRGMPARYALDNPLPAEVALLPETISEDFHTLTPAIAERADPQATCGVTM